jgi:membrane associated rhomboid family serine protease
MHYKRSSFGFGRGLTPVIKNLLIANAVIFILSINGTLYNKLIEQFAIIPIEIFTSFKIWQLFTYMFLHGGFWHILMNMYFLWMFGTELEQAWGSRQFLKFYFICGIGAGLFILALSPLVSFTIGASGAIYGVMVAFAVTDPNRVMVLNFLFPVKVKYFVGFLVAISFFSTLNFSSDGISHVGHLGGGLIGFIYMKFGHKLHTIWRSLKSQSPTSGKSKKSNLKYTPGGGSDKVEFYRQRIDEILDKINRVGYLNLTDEEKKVLEEGSQYLREHDDVDYN